MTFKEACIAQEYNLPVIVTKSNSTDWSDENTVFHIREVHRGYDCMLKQFFNSATVYNSGRACYQVDISLVNFVNSQSIEDFVLDKLKFKETEQTKRFINKLLDEYNSKKCIFEYIGKLVDDVKAERKAAGIKGHNNSSRQDIYIEIISYLNTAAGLNLNPKSANTRKLIDDRLNDGFTVDNFKKVIDTKCNDWKTTEMSKYLRPSTLFSKKHFEEYLNQKDGSKIQTVATYGSADELTEKALLNDKYDI